MYISLNFISWLTCLPKLWIWERLKSVYIKLLMFLKYIALLVLSFKHIHFCTGRLKTLMIQQQKCLVMY